MKSPTLHFLPGYRSNAGDLASRLNIPSYLIEIHKFPDGESKIRVEPVDGTVILYASLDRPNEKLIHLAFAAATFRDLGAKRLVLVAPYLCYMRQDKAFVSGEAVSQRIIGRYLSSYFDRVITVDPHLHRIDNLQSVFGNCRADALTATGIIANTLAAEGVENMLLAGPDAESEQWVRAIAGPLSLPYVIGAKVRSGDRDVEVSFSADRDMRAARVILLDDVISSGKTICEAAASLKKMGVQNIEAVTVHMLANNQDVAAIHAAGVSTIRSTDSVAHESNSLSLAPLLCEALLEEKEQ